MSRNRRTCPRCGHRFTNITRHRQGAARMCDVNLLRDIVAEKQREARRAGWTPAWPAVRLIQNMQLPARRVIAELYPVNAVNAVPNKEHALKSYVDAGPTVASDPVYVPEAKLMALPYHKVWSHKWIVNVATSGLKLPIRKALLHRLSVDEDFFLEYHDPDFQGAMGAALRLDGWLGVKEMVLARWGRELGLVKPPAGPFVRKVTA